MSLTLFNGQAHSIWVSVVIFSRRRENNEANNQAHILLQHASRGGKSGYRDSGSGSRAESGDAIYHA
ncbi:hypothetical protein ASPFODRAFT_53955 [Aspergillus luchuensis CBS 106.47]|uniref:Uncharacterized protein n=1 Tax=Aspergillus luchuensis (strain CBS 106.47) TaxID=1137211 RepID=A0A1M3T024_ASPLC|nr:hypothetical protein ASPFODRAFT_53955 [Aspergillus luchuensis CBS 106.47]